MRSKRYEDNALPDREFMRHYGAYGMRRHYFWSGVVSFFFVMIIISIVNSFLGSSYPVLNWVANVGWSLFGVFLIIGILPYLFLWPWRTYRYSAYAYPPFFFLGSRQYGYDEDIAIQIAKERLARGEITVRGYRVIIAEIKRNARK
jgi:uncharacterized membrane protein